MKHKNENEKSTLNWKERLRLIIEALITGAIIILLYVSVITIVQFIISHLPETIEETWPLEYLSNLDNEVIYMIAPFFIVLSLIFLKPSLKAATVSVKTGSIYKAFSIKSPTTSLQLNQTTPV